MRTSSLQQDIIRLYTPCSHTASTSIQFHLSGSNPGVITYLPLQDLHLIMKRFSYAVKEIADLKDQVCLLSPTPNQKTVSTPTRNQSNFCLNSSKSPVEREIWSSTPSPVPVSPALAALQASRRVVLVETRKSVLRRLEDCDTNCQEENDGHFRNLREDVREGDGDSR